ncbi:DUF2971 domain-containing protein [Dyadobacter sp. CY261]|uniref:DUF2971 domain-containing protein n=1 Tax=Dyadobacter sp. CY261 TaxID=2907203 RepID=UPI001F17EF6F|nr:DUF2971 domain-containing protein [Dyadobacter sp. CY261]MCF0072230.1 DUF2971 domain-containing protein [Dyadobacter sp. CY261]
MTESQYRNFLGPLLSNFEIQEDFQNLIPNVIDENLSFLSPAEKKVIEQFLKSSQLPTLFSTLLDPLILLHLTAKQPGLNFNLKNDLNNRFGILSLTTRNDNLTMWSHYAFEHKGFVIELRPESQIFQNAKSKIKLFRSLQKVSYRGQRPSATLLDSLDNAQGLSSLLRKIFLMKSLDWKYEQELRMLTTLNDEGVREVSPGIFVKGLEAASILNVFLGVNSNATLKEDILKILARPDLSHVGVFQGVIDENEYEVIFESVN